MNNSLFGTPLLPLAVVIPLIAAIVSLLLTSPRARAITGIGFATLLLFALAPWLWHTPGADLPTSVRYALGGWGAPLGIDLHLDGFATVLLLSTAALVIVLSIYSAFYFAGQSQAARFWPLWWMLVAGLNGVFLAADAFNVYVLLEIIGLASVALVALAGTREACTAALRYALVGLLGSLCYLLGVALLYRHYGTLDFAQLAALAQADPLTWAALALVTAGLLLKTALLPLHFWLPSAHANAPAPVSAVLSALVVKASFYLIARYWLDILSPAVTDLGSMLLGLLGAVAVIWGCVAAFRAHRLKLLVAYSTVAQLGYLFLLFPLAASGTDTHMALEAVVYFIVAHALAKAAMFLAAGNILRACGHDDIARLRGVAGQQPASLFIFAIAGVSLIGLPPSGGFIAKWLLLNTAISSGQWWWAVVVLCGGLLAALYIFKVLNLAFVRVDLPSGQIPQPVSAPTHAGMTLCAFALAIGAVALGFSAEWLVTLLDAGSSVTTFSQGAGT